MSGVITYSRLDPATLCEAHEIAFHLIGFRLDLIVAKASDAIETITTPDYNKWYIE